MRAWIAISVVGLFGVFGAVGDMDPEPLGFGWATMPATITVGDFVLDQLPVDMTPTGFTAVASIPTGGVFDSPITLNQSVFHCQVGADGFSWAMGRQPEVYYCPATGMRTPLVLAMPADVGAFAFWAQPVSGGASPITVRAYSQFGDYTEMTQYPSAGGALGFGFGRLFDQMVDEVHIFSTVDFLIGEEYGFKIEILQDYGACCYDDGSCAEMYEGNCYDTGGTFTMDEAPCWPNPCPQPPPGACCLVGGGCSFVSEYECEDLGGVFFSDIECFPNQCPPIGACCTGIAGECVVTSEFGCGFMQGMFIEGWSCASMYCPELGACCFPDGSCEFIPPSNCDAQGGVYRGAQTGCRDSDQNGIPDVCDVPTVWTVEGRYFDDDRAALYFDDVPLEEEFRALVEWWGHTPGDVIFTTQAGSFVGTQDPQNPNWYTFTCDVSQHFTEGAVLDVVAVSGRESSSRRFANIEFLRRPGELVDTIIEAIPEGSELRYAADEIRSTGDFLMDEGVSRIPGDLHLFGGEPFKFGNAINGTIDFLMDGRIYSQPFATPEKKIRMAGLEFEASASGQFWWDLSFQSGNWGPGGHFEADASISGNCPPNPIRFVIVFVPCYIRGTIAADAHAEFELAGWNTDTGEPEWYALVELGPEAEVGLGIGCEYVASIECSIGGGATMRLDFPKAEGYSSHLTELKVFMKGSIRFRAFYIFTKEFSVKQTWSVNTREMVNELEPGAWSIVSRDYLDAERAYAVFVANDPPRRDTFGRAFEEQPFQLNVFDRSTPDLVSHGDDLVAVWVHDDETRSSVNRTELVFSQYDSASETWSAPVPVADDGTADFQPQLAALPDGSTLLVWSNANETLIEPGEPGDACITQCLPPCDEPCDQQCADECADTCMYAPDPLACQAACIAACESACEDACEADCRVECKANEMKQASEIVVAQCDAASGVWASPVRLTTNAILDHTPQIATAPDGTAIVAWVSNVAGSEYGSAATPNVLKYARYDGAAWSVAAEIAADVPSVLSLSLASRGDEAVLVFAGDTDDDTGTVDDVELFATTFDGTTWGAITPLTMDAVHDANPRVAYDHLGNLLLVWYRSGDIVMSTSLGLTDMHTIVDLPHEASMGVADFRLGTGPAGQIALVWQEPSEDLVDIWSSVYDAGFQVWSSPQRLTADDSETHSLEQALAPTFDARGDLVLLYDKTHMGYRSDTVTIDEEVIPINNIPDPQLTDLYFLRHDLVPQPAINADEVTLSPENPRPGNVVTISSVVHNTGSLSATGIQLRFYDGDPDDGGMLIGSASDPGPLAGGRFTTLSIDWTIPPEPVERDIYLVVSQSRKTRPDARHTVGARNENTTVVVPLFRPDLRIDGVHVSVVNETDRELTVRVRNHSALPIDGTSVELRQEDETGTILATLPWSDPIPPDSFFDVSWTWEDAGPFVDGIARVYVAVDPTDALAEFDETNNSRTTIVRRWTTVADCNDNGMSDIGDIAGGTSEDCNANGVPDECDIADGTSEDTNGDSVPDECSACTLTASVSGQGSVSLDPPGGTYWIGDTVELTAEADPGWRFDHWTGGATGSDNPITIELSGSTTVTAVFVAKTYDLTVYISGQGNVLRNPPAGPYAHGTTVDLTAEALAGWQFEGWGGAASGSVNPTSVVMDGPKTVSAFFEQILHLLTVHITGQGTVDLFPSGGVYAPGTEVTLTADALDAWCFVEWGGALGGSINPESLVIGGPLTVNATFAVDCNRTGVPDIDETILGGDFDADGAVDSDDFVAWASAMRGPDNAPVVEPSSCLGVYLNAFDSDGDGDLDLADFAALR